MVHGNVADGDGVLVIYTGGTIGSRPRDADDADSPQYVVSWEALREATPEIAELEKRGFRIDCESFSPPLDSCNVGPEEWLRMAEVVNAHYREYAGFVVLHGTDTMTYSAAALSLMLRDLSKPVVFTGAQRSALVDVRNDAIQNFITSLLLANPAFSGLPTIPEVVICFGGKILRGNRTVKDDTVGYTAYDSPNMDLLGIAGDRIVINESLLRPCDPKLPLRVRKNLARHVLPVFVYPGMPIELVKSILAMPDLCAVIVQSFGSGNIPNPPELVSAFREARAAGIVIANITQCRRGPVELGIYETSAELLDAGFISASDITVEAAQCKLMVLLGDPDYELDEVEAAFQASIAGEQTTSLYVARYPQDTLEVHGPADYESAPLPMRLPAESLPGVWDRGRVTKILVRCRRARIVAPTDDGVQFRLFLNADPGESLADDGKLIGTFQKWPAHADGLVLFDVTEKVAPIAQPGERVSLTMVLDTPQASFHWERTEIAIYVTELGR